MGGHGDRLLTECRVPNQEDLIWFDLVADTHKIVNKFMIDLQAAGRVNDHRVVSVMSRLEAGGLGDLAGKIFRIGHMGRSIEPAEVQLLLDAIEESLRVSGTAVPQGADLENAPV